MTNREFSKALGRALHRPAVAPVPAFALRLLYGDMAEIVTEGQRAVPPAPQALGYAFRRPGLDDAIAAAARLSPLSQTAGRAGTPAGPRGPGTR